MDKKDHKPLHGARKNKKSPKKPCHKRIFQKSGDIFFGATSHKNHGFCRGFSLFI